MNKKILYLSLAVVVLILCASSVTAFVSPSPGIKDPTFSKVWVAIMDLQTQIKNIQLIPGPTGPTGPTGPAGTNGVNGKDGAPGADGATVHFGPNGAVYDSIDVYEYEAGTAATDGFAMAKCYANDVNIRTVVFGNINNVQQIRSVGIAPPPEVSGGWPDSMIVMPVAKGEVWKVYGLHCSYFSVYWRPLIS